MSTCKLSIQKWVLARLRLNFITCLAVLFSFSAGAQLPGQLPVNLKTFEARAEDNNKVKVFWTTSYEKDNGYFDIERSADGVNFTGIGKVTGVNHSGILTDYIFYDTHAMKGISFYRLKQVDVDTKFSYSPIVRVRNLNVDNSFGIFPNPAPGAVFKIDLLKNIQGNIDVKIFDLSGRLQLQQQFTDGSTISIYHHLASGLYIIKINGKEFTETKRLVIQ